MEDIAESYQHAAFRGLLEQPTYLHVDVSDQFTSSGKGLVAGLFIFVQILLRIRPYHDHALISFAGAIAMVGLRSLPHFGPTYDLMVVIEPLIFMLGSQLLLHSLPNHRFWTVKCGVRRTPIRMFLAAIGVTIVLGDYSAFALFSEHVNVTTTNNDIMTFALLTGATVGSTLSLTGNVSNMVAQAVAYDNFEYLSFATNHFLPFIVALVMYLLPLYLHTRFGFFQWLSDNQTDDYSGIGLHDLELVESASTRIDDAVPVVLETGKSGPDSVRVEDVAAVLEEEPVDQGTRNNDGDHLSVFMTHSYAICIPLMMAPYIRVQATWASYGLLIVGILGFAIFLVSFLKTREAHLLLIFLFLLYSIGVDHIFAVLVMAKVCVLIFRRDRSAEVMGSLDYLDAVKLGCQMILTTSLNDAGVVQYIFVTLDQEGAYDPMKFYLAISLCTICVGPMNCILMVAATMPFITPYIWMQVAFISSALSGVAWSPIERPKMRSWLGYIMLALPAFFSLSIGVFLLTTFHSAFECSMKLGDCG